MVTGSQVALAQEEEERRLREEEARRLREEDKKEIASSTAPYIVIQPVQQTQPSVQAQPSVVAQPRLAPHQLSPQGPMFSCPKGMPS
ncbi:hypothetical protein CRG98_012823 [Punica granatum]|uniref:Uncharacterized protein n=1 Tax=Punica granatum TaxID=22663 RepID=A0A2I0KE71_PUNGR|nr:hypothetical protein CRG98_012823 [Punica granatum]